MANQRATSSLVMPGVLKDNLLVESASGLTEDDVRSAVITWLSVEDGEEVLRAEKEGETRSRWKR